MSYEQFVHTIGTVNFRQGPATTYPVIKNLAAKTVVQILEEIPNTTWAKARLEDGREGYITTLSQYVEDYTPAWLEKAKRVIAYGEKYLGVPYVFGSSRYTDKDFDCSDFVQWILEKELNVIIDHDSRSQSNDGDPIGTGYEVLRTGDLIFFDTNHDGVINHVGMYVYPHKILHTYSKTADIYDSNFKLIRKGGGGVTYSRYQDGTSWRENTTGARRVIK